jgi:hypothetical protein
VWSTNAVFTNGFINLVLVTPDVSPVNSIDQFHVLTRIVVPARGYYNYLTGNNNRITTAGGNNYKLAHRCYHQVNGLKYAYRLLFQEPWLPQTIGGHIVIWFVYKV